jgi:hypothetical protein
MLPDYAGLKANRSKGKYHATRHNPGPGIVPIMPGAA